MIKNDEELMLLAIKKDGKQIKWTEKLQNKKSMVLMAIKSNPLALEFVGEKFKNDKSMVSKAVKMNGTALRFASDTLKADPEIVKLAISSNPYSIHHASDNLKNDPNIAMSAIKYGQIYGLTRREMGNFPVCVLEYVGKELLKDKDFMIKALKIEPEFFFHNECINDPEVVLSLGIKAAHCTMIESLFENKQFTKKFFKRIVKDLFGNGPLSNVICKQATNFEDEIRQYMKNPKAFVKQYLEKFETRESALQYYSHFEIIPEKYRSDRELIKYILKNNPYNSLRTMQAIIDPNLLTDIDFLNELIQINPKAISLVSDEKSKWELLKNINFDVFYCPTLTLQDLFGIPRLLALELVSKKGELLKLLSPDLRDDREIVYKAILNDPNSIQYASEDLQKDKKLILMIIDLGVDFHYIHPDIQFDFDILKRVFEINNLPCSIDE